MPLIGRYPHDVRRQPRPLSANAISAFAESIRRQMLGPVVRGAPDLDRIVSRADQVSINSVTFAIVWDLETPVHDGTGHPVLGVCEHDPGEPHQVMISVNTPALPDRPDIARSTALHELGHALFDMPAVVHAAQHGCWSRVGSSAHAPKENGSAELDWCEWRANAFMGAFLAPPVAMHQRLVRLARMAGLPLLNRASGGKTGLPVVDMANADGDAVVEALAEELGISVEFAWVRLIKYRLVAGREAHS